MVRGVAASDAAVGDQFGISVSLLGDRGLVGAWGDDGGAGSAYFGLLTVERVVRRRWIGVVLMILQRQRDVAQHAGGLRMVGAEVGLVQRQRAPVLLLGLDVASSTSR